MPRHVTHHGIVVVGAGSNLFVGDRLELVLSNIFHSSKSPALYGYQDKRTHCRRRKISHQGDDVRSRTLDLANLEDGRAEASDIA